MSYCTSISLHLFSKNIFPLSYRISRSRPCMLNTARPNEHVFHVINECPANLNRAAPVQQSFLVVLILQLMQFAECQVSHMVSSHLNKLITHCRGVCQFVQTKLLHRDVQRKRFILVETFSVVFLLLYVGCLFCFFTAL